jgi:hypothetical protein
MGKVVSGLATRVGDAMPPFLRKLQERFRPGAVSKVVAGASKVPVPASGPKREMVREMVHRVGQYFPKGQKFNPFEHARRTYSAMAPIFPKIRAGAAADRAATTKRLGEMAEKLRESRALRASAQRT